MNSAPKVEPTCPESESKVLSPNYGISETVDSLSKPELFP
jgi:hypothetical protein